jgi:NADH dehydrogenase
LLYQVATAALSPGDIAAPIRSVLHKHENVEVIMGEAVSIDRENRKVILTNSEVPFDYLVIATGARHFYFGHDEWEKYAYGLKTLRDALSIREKILLSFERAERICGNDENADISKYMTFVIVGGGPTGVEMAGAIAEIAKKTMLKDFRHINTLHTKILLVEGLPRILPVYSPDLSEKAKKSLEELGVEVHLNSLVSEVNENGVKFGDTYIETVNVIWAAGNKASGLLKTLNTELDKAGRAVVENDLSIKEDPDIFVIGDAACFYLDAEKKKSLPGVAPVAITQGRYLAKILKTQTPKDKRKPYKYFDKGNLATIGTARAIAEIGKIKLSGYIAWLAWGFVHILFLIGFRNRYRVMSEWIWLYLTNRQGIRLITHKTDY